jgi:hypothetical protein
MPYFFYIQSRFNSEKRDILRHQDNIAEDTNEVRSVYLLSYLKIHALI